MGGSGKLEQHKILIDLAHNTKHGFIYMGKVLKELYENDEFRSVVGEGIDTWNDYLSQPEIGLSVGEADRYIGYYGLFVERAGISPEEIANVPLRNLQYIFKHKQDGTKEEIRELLDNATVLRPKDFRLFVNERGDFKEDEATYTYMIMKRCNQTGSMTKVHEASSDQILGFLGRLIHNYNG